MSRPDESPAAATDLAGSLQQALTPLVGAVQLSLAEIAAELDYTDQSNFTRAFHRWTGESPGAYRRRRLSLRSPAPLSRFSRVSTG